MTELAIVVEFVDRLRRAGVAVDPARDVVAAEALARLHGTGWWGTYWALRLTLCSRAADRERFDAAFWSWIGDDVAAAESESAVAALNLGGAEANTTSAELSDVDGGPSEAERMAVRDLRTLNAAELDEIKVLIAQLSPAMRPRRVFRRVPGGHSRIDVRRNVRMMVRHGGEPARLYFRRPGTRPRRLLLLIDISRSMSAYSDAFLRFAHAAVAAGPKTTEVFTLGTQWTRITKQLRANDPETAMREVARLESDWDSGTLLGRSIQELLRVWRGRNAVRSAVVLIVSDGLESGTGELLGKQVERLSRIGHRLIWVNPMKDRRPGYRPVMRGLVASLPFADEHLAGYSFADLRRLAEVIAQ